MATKISLRSFPIGYCLLFFVMLLFSLISNVLCWIRVSFHNFIGSDKLLVIANVALCSFSIFLWFFELGKCAMCGFHLFLSCYVGKVVCLSCFFSFWRHRAQSTEGVGLRISNMKNKKRYPTRKHCEN